ncbi:MAG: ribosome maturation factor RimP [bacterium]
MAKQVDISVIESWLGPLLTEMGLELVEIESAREPKGFILRIYIDRPEGVTVSDCEKVSEQISFRIDTNPELKQQYNISRLEVSSPGLDRNLKTEKDFRRYLGRKIRVIIKSEALRSQETGPQGQSRLAYRDGKQNTFSGILKSYGNNQIVLIDQKTSQKIEIAISDIATANLEVDWNSEFKAKN